METPYPFANHYGPANYFYRPLQDLFHPLRTTLYYIVWQILASKSVKVKRSGDKELTLCLQTTLTTISVLKSLNTNTLSLWTTTYRSNTRKTLRTLQKLFLKPTTLLLSTNYKPIYITKVYKLKGINELLLYSPYTTQYTRRTKQNRLKRKS